MALTKPPGVALVSVLWLAGLVAVPPAAAQDKTARGIATAVTDVSLTLKVGDRDLTFDVDGRTVVQAPAARRQARAAQPGGASGVKLTSAIQSGQPVQVTYHEVNGRNLASDITRLSIAGSRGGSLAEAAAVTGIVKSATGSVLVITSDGRDQTFVIDRETVVAGSGAGAAAARGSSGSMPSLIEAGDTVRIRYSTAAGTMKATEVRITGKAR